MHFLFLPMPNSPKQEDNFVVLLAYCILIANPNLIMQLRPPILIASPVRRSGTTLIQRLLCSSENTLIYGESCAGELQILLNVLTSRHLYFQSSQKMRDEILQEVLEGQVNEWIPDLMPNLEEYLKILPQRYLSIFQYYQEFAERHQRSIWGMKMAEWNATQIRQAMQTFPQSKLIYIIRDLEGCVRSAKRINVLQGVAEIQQFAQIWQQNIQIVQTQLPTERILFIDYQAFIKDPLPIIQQMEAFTGARKIDTSVMGHRINTYKQTHFQGQPEDGYLQPSDLSPEELDFIHSFTNTSSKI